MTEHLCQGTESRLLIVDGHNSHFSPEFISFCSEHRIHLFCIPPHTTHLLQSLDVGLFGPLQNQYSKLTDQRMSNGQGVVRKGNFLPMLREARSLAYTKRT